MNSRNFQNFNQLSSLCVFAVSLVLLATVACNQTKTQNTNNPKKNSNQVELSKQLHAPVTTQKPISPKPPYTKSTSNKPELTKISDSQYSSEGKIQPLIEKIQVEEIVQDRIEIEEDEPRIKPIRLQFDSNMPDSRVVNVPDFNTEDYDPIVENDFLATTAKPVSTFSIDVDAAAYANMRRMINYGQKPNKSAIRIEEMINYFNYNYPQPKGEDPFEVVTELSECPWNKNHQLFHIGLQGLEVDVSQLPNSNLVFLVDVSGSMNAPNKLSLLIESFKLLTQKLRQDDQVAIVVYAGSSGVVLPSTNGTEKATILNALNRLRAGGSTAGAAGIELAYKIAKENYIEGGNNRVILATDGDFNVGYSSDGGLVNLIERKREDGIFLSVLGFGMGNYKDNKMQKLSNKGNGNHYYIDGLLEAKKVLVNEFGGTLFTIAKDVKLQLEFNPAKVAAYRLIGYENRMLKTQDFNDDKKDAGELGSGHTVTALYELIPANAESKYLEKTDPLKYQSKQILNSSEELLTVKLRYKKPDEDKSKLIEIPILEEKIALAETSEAYKFAASVAEFGLLLRSSAYKENASFESVINLSKSALGNDKFGYRAEFISLVKKVQNM